MGNIFGTVPLAHTLTPSIKSTKSYDTNVPSALHSVDTMQINTQTNPVQPIVQHGPILSTKINQFSNGIKDSTYTYVTNKNTYMVPLSENQKTIEHFAALLDETIGNPPVKQNLVNPQKIIPFSLRPHMNMWFCIF